MVNAGSCFGGGTVCRGGSAMVQMLHINLCILWHLALGYLKNKIIYYKYYTK